MFLPGLSTAFASPRTQHCLCFFRDSAPPLFLPGLSTAFASLKTHNCPFVVFITAFAFSMTHHCLFLVFITAFAFSMTHHCLFLVFITAFAFSRTHHCLFLVFITAFAFSRAHHCLFLVFIRGSSLLVSDFVNVKFTNDVLFGTSALTCGIILLYIAMKFVVFKLLVRYLLHISFSHFFLYSEVAFED